MKRSSFPNMSWPTIRSESAGVRLFEANLRMVVAIAKQYGGAGVRVLTLVQKGNEGLLFALKTLYKAENPD